MFITSQTWTLTSAAIIKCISFLYVNMLMLFIPLAFFIFTVFLKGNLVMSYLLFMRQLQVAV